MKNIRTGADRLVELISEKKRILLDDAAKQLGVGIEVVQEWADFLEQEGIIKVEYKLSKVWLNEKKISKDQVMTAARDVASERDALIRKIDVALRSLDKETLGFDEVRKQFNEVQSHIKTEMETVKNELEELERFESLKRNLDKEIEQQKKYYEDMLGRHLGDLKEEEKKYDGLKAEIEKEKKIIGAYGEKLGTFRKSKEELEASIKAAKEALANSERSIGQEEKNVEKSIMRLKELEKYADKIQTVIDEKKQSNLGDIMKEFGERKKKIMEQQDDLIRRSKQKAEEMTAYGNASKRIYDAFKGFFLKKINTQRLIEDIEKEKNEMLSALAMLRRKVEAFTIMTKDISIKAQMSQFEAELKDIERRKNTVSKKIEDLIELIKS